MRRSVRTRVTGLVLAVLICACAILLAARWLQRRELHHHHANEARELAVFVTAEYGRALEETRRLLSVAALLPEVSSPRDPACPRRLSRVLREHPELLNLGITDASGRIVCSAAPVSPQTTLAGRSAFEQAMKSRGFHAGGVQTGALSKEAGLTAVLPLGRDDGAVEGAVFALLDLEKLSRRIGTLPSPDIALTLVDRHGTVIAQSPETTRWIGQPVPLDHPLHQRLRSGGFDTADEVGLDGRSLLFSFVHVTLPHAEPAWLAVGVPASKVFGALEPAFGASMVGMATLLVLALAATWLGTSFLFVRRIEALQVLAQRLRSGDLGARIVVAPGKDELGDLSRTLDGLAGELDLANRRREELQRQLRQAVELREEFLSVAAHELRTPITSIRLQMEMLSRGMSQLPIGPGTAPLRNRVAVLMRQIDRLGRLVSTLLELSRLSNGQFTLEMEPLDLCDVIRGISERLTEDVEHASAKLCLNLPDSAPALGDKLRLEQVMTNLLSNALKYGGGTPIEVGLEQGGKGWALRVRDHGSGIPADKLDRIFNRFERAATDVSGGLGLGLYISRQIVEAHSGTIRARNAEGGGAELVVELPRRLSGQYPVIVQGAAGRA